MGGDAGTARPGAARLDPAAVRLAPAGRCRSRARPHRPDRAGPGRTIRSGPGGSHVEPPDRRGGGGTRRGGARHRRRAMARADRGGAGGARRIRARQGAAGPAEGEPVVSLAAHMLAHSVLVAVVAPLIILARPVNIVLAGLSPNRRLRALAALRSRPARLLTAPPVAWGSFVGTQLAFHLTGLYDSVLSDPWVDAVAHALYAATALIFWEVAIGSAPLARRLTGMGPALYLLLTMPAIDLS